MLCRDGQMGRIASHDSEKNILLFELLLLSCILCGLLMWHRLSSTFVVVLTESLDIKLNWFVNAISGEDRSALRCSDVTMSADIRNWTLIRENLANDEVQSLKIILQNNSLLRMSVQLQSTVLGMHITEPISHTGSHFLHPQ